MSLPSSGSKSYLHHLTSEPRSQDLNRRERLSLFACLLKWTLDAGEKLSERDPENTMANRYLRELSSKADGMNFSLRTTFFGEGKHGQDPAGTLFVLGKLSTCSFRAPRISKSIFIRLEWLIFRWTVSFIILCVYLNTVSSSFQSFFLFLLESVMRAMMFNLSLFSPF